MKKILSFLIVLSVFTVSVSAATISSECDFADIDTPLEATAVNAAIGQTLDIKAKSCILMEPHTGTILYESNSDEQLAPASITKIMSLLLIMEAMENEKFTLETPVSASEYACSMGGSQIWLEPGETMTVDELLKAAVIASANDATVALGETVAGSEEGFVALMNERAKELGMENTNFINCTGLDADGHLTTAHDVAIMSGELIKHELIKNYTTVWMDTLRNGESELVNTNKLVRFYEGATGLKTGTTGKAGYCLSATAMRDGMELVAVVMNGETTQDRFNGAKKLLDFGFANYSFQKLDSGFEKPLTVKVANGTKSQIDAEANGTFSMLSEKNKSGDITRKTNLNKNIKAPIKKGDIIGSVSIFMNDKEVGSIPITAAEDSDKLSFGITFIRIIKGLFQL